MKIKERERESMEKEEEVRMDRCGRKRNGSKI